LTELVCFIFRNSFNSTFSNQPQWNTSNDGEFDVPPNAMASNVNQTPKVNNHQKTAERMAEDESKLSILVIFDDLLMISSPELGDMSTISAVLYANQNHPELKVEYPQWSDRYKQIMKKWRALSSDKKAPYLQRARDNRSAQQAQLRTKKAQQVSPEQSLMISTYIYVASPKPSKPFCPQGSCSHLCISSLSSF
jgi:hypothetical protein